MSHLCVRPRCLLTAALAGLIASAAPHGARAAGKLDAQYAITFAGITVGNGKWSIEFGPDKYEMTANGGASGIVRVVASGEGELMARGSVKDGRPVPEKFVSSLTRDEHKTELIVTFDDGKVAKVESDEKPNPDRVPVTDAHRQGVLDPISALLLPASGDDTGLTAEACRRTLHIFDGKHRFDLKFSFKRMDKVKADTGYSGPAVVCAIEFQPIAGHRPQSRLVRYLSDKREIEAWYAPVAGARLLAPFKLMIAGMLGNVVIQAKAFEVTANSKRAAVKPGADAR